jgi:hypothetical protein
MIQLISPCPRLSASKWREEKKEREEDGAKRMRRNSIHCLGKCSAVAGADGSNEAGLWRGRETRKKERTREHGEREKAF